MPVLLSSLIDAPAEELAGALAADESRCCLRDWLALVPDPRSRLGRWHSIWYSESLPGRRTSVQAFMPLQEEL